MIFILLGAFSFLLFFLYDVNQVTGRPRFFKLGFIAGTTLLTCSTTGLVITLYPYQTDGVLKTILFLAFGLGFFVLFIYTLFFALPARDTYAGTSDALVTTGVYALCRHPGVIWLAGVYLCLWRALGNREFFVNFLLVTVLNVIYVLFQDLWTFPRLFGQYPQYKKTTPFLIPNLKSLKRCIESNRSPFGDKGSP